MFTHYRTQAFILKRINRGEADQLLVVYTKDFGRIEVMAKGVRKVASKLRPAVEFPAIIDLEFIQGKTCKTLTDAVTLIPLKHSRRDPDKREVITRIAAMAEILIKDQQSDSNVWDLVCSAAVFAETADRRNSDAIYQYFVWHLFESLGWRPEFGADFAGAACRSLVRLFRDSDIARSAKMRLTGSQVNNLDRIARDYLALITK